jgi:hypothetical protein
MTDIDYTALNEQAQILYHYAYTAGRAFEQDAENSRVAREQAEKSLRIVLAMVKLAVELPSTYAPSLAAQASNVLYTTCPTAYSPNLYRIQDALKPSSKWGYNDAIGFIEDDLDVLKEAER